MSDQKENLLYRLIFENSPVGILHYDKDGIVTECNRAHLKILGADEDQVVGFKLLESLGDKRMLKAIQTSLKGKKSAFIGDYRSVTGRRPVTIKVECAPILGDNGDVMGGLAIVEDISDRTRVEKDLQIQTAYLEELFEGSPEVIAILDNDDRIVKINRQFTKVFGYTLDEIKGQPINDLIVPDDLADEGLGATQSVAKGGTVELESERITKDGKRLHVTIIGQPVVFQGVQLGIYAIYRDITAAKIAEYERTISEERYRRLVETSPDAIIQIDLDGNFLEANPLAAELFGFVSRTKLLDSGTSILNFLNIKEKRSAKRFLKDARKTGLLQGVEFTLSNISGKETPVEISTSIIEEQTSHHTAITCFIRDISQRKETERLLHETEQQLRQSQKMEAIGRLAGGIAHDFNNLLTAIGGNVEMAMMKANENDSIFGFLKGVQEAADRAAELTKSLLAFSRRQPMEMKIIDLNENLAVMDQMLRRVIGEDIELIAHAAKDLWAVKVDPSQMEQVILNLAVNARDAMPSGGKLTIETENVELDDLYLDKHPEIDKGKYVMVAVSDTGEGMPEDVQAKIFEPFYTTKEKGKGTGLGLSTVYGIIKQFGGYIWVYSEINVGTIFKLYLPMVEEEISHMQERKTYFETPHGNERLLVVEDEYAVRHLAVSTLERLGYKVFEAASGKEAMEVCYELDKPVDLIVSDVIMPQMNGADMAKEIRKHIWPDIKVLFVSGYTEDAIVHDGFLEPGTPYLQKPFRLVDLAKRVREELDK